MEYIVQSFLIFQINLKVYHWQTTSFSRHKATDTLYSSLSEKIDRFVEALQGSRNERFVFEKNQTIDLRNVNDKNGKELLTTFLKWLENDLKRSLLSSETDLINLCEEMINDIHQTLYLFSLE